MLKPRRPSHDRLMHFATEFIPRSEFPDHLKTKPVLKIRKQFERAKGNLRALLSLLARLAPPVPPNTRAIVSRLRRCKTSLREVMTIGSPPIPHFWWRLLKPDLHSLYWTLSLTLEDQTESKTYRSHGTTGRPPGPTQASLIVAVLAREFCQRFGRPRLNDILVLVQHAAPETFPLTITREHLRQRIRNVPANEVKRAHHRFFA